MTKLLKVCSALFLGVFLSFSMVFGQSSSAQEFKIDPFLNGLKINHLGGDEFETHHVVVEYAVKPLEGSILEPKWQLTDVVAFQNGKAIVVDDFKLNTDYLYRVGLVDAKIQGEVYPEKISWISEVHEFHSKSVVENIFVSPKETKIKVAWTLDYTLLSDLSDYGIVVSYNLALEEKRKEKKFAAQDWTKSDVLPISTMNYEITGLKDNENYVVRVGIVNKDTGKEWYSPKQAVATERAWGVVKFLILMGALGLFIYGMKVMSDGLQQAAGSKLRNWLRAITSNRLKGVFAGIGIH